MRKKTMHKNYIILLNTFIACTSMAMTENVERTEKVVATFSNPINRFAISHDGKQLVTSEDETFCSYYLRRRQAMSSTIRIWKQTNDGTYNNTISKKLSLSYKRGVALRWLNDNKNIILLTFNTYGSTDNAAIEYTRHDAQTLAPAGIINRPFTEKEVDLATRGFACDINSLVLGTLAARTINSKDKTSLQIDQNKAVLIKMIKN